MSNFDAEKLYLLLPSIYRIRDTEQGGPLKALLTVIGEQIELMEENIEQLYDDQFIETCAGWVVPYIGDLIGYRTLHGKNETVSSPRAEVAHTIALRRRKGTASVLEQLARDVTSWNARAVEFFQMLATTQYMNHIRLGNHYAPDLRKWETLEYVGTAFNTVAHTVDVRRIATGRGRFNIPNVGLFLWPIGANRATRSAAVKVDDRRWRISPLNHDMRLYNRPEAETNITHLAEPVNVPMPFSRRVLHEDVLQYYGEGLSLALYINDDPTPVPISDVKICNLGDDGTRWAHLPTDGYAIDPVLGRVALPAGGMVTKVHVTHHYGFGAKIGGGEYPRTQSFTASPTWLVRVPSEYPTITAALSALSDLGGGGVVEVGDSQRYEEALDVTVKPGERIELRAADECRPSLVLTPQMTISGGDESEFVLNGLLVSGGKLVVPAAGENQLRYLRIAHATLVPGWALTAQGFPSDPDEPSIVVETGSTEVLIERSIIGGLRSHQDVKLKLVDSILDATRVEGIASAGLDGRREGGSLSMEGCTSIGKLHATAMPLISSSILLADLRPEDSWSTPVQAKQRQTGCVRFSWLPREARVPRRYRCQPEAGSTVSPRILSLLYGSPFYCWLSATTANAIRRGAEDEGEMGVYHHLHVPQRETDLRVRLDEYLRAGLEAGIFYEL